MTELNEAAAATLDPVSSSTPERPSRIGRLESLPKWLNLIPMIVQWLWLSIQHGSWTLPAAANPRIAGGGLAGEGKSDYFRAMGKLAIAHTAEFAVFRNTQTSLCLNDAEQCMAQAGLAYPLILKPDIGWCGFGVRIVRSRDELEAYLDSYPPHEDIILQKFVPYEGEAGIFFVRMPGEARGHVVGMLLRFFPRVVGDGHSTIAELMARNARTRRLGLDGRSEPWCNTSIIPSAGEIVRLSVTGSTRVGGLYEDASSLVSQELEDAINAIAMDIDQLHAARFDVRYETIGGMLAGHSFKIIEVNGAGSEAVHAWDPRYTLLEAYKIVFEKQRMLFSIGANMRKRGHKPPSSWKIVKMFWRQAQLIRHYPLSN